MRSAQPIELRDYQSRAIERLRASYRSGHRAPLLALPTGGGKTVIFAEASRRRSHAEIAAYRRAHGYKPGWEYFTRRMMAELPQ